MEIHMTINWLIILCIILLIWRIVEGFNRGMVKEIISCVSLIVLSIVAILAMTAFTRYMKKDILSMASAIIILLVVLLAHRILGIVFFSAKLVSKLPVIHSADKLLGAVVGVAETALIIWLVFAMTGKMGMVGSLIVENIADSRILQFLYSHNYLQAVLNQMQRVIS